jgi:tetratricopeptide (TPR) repeat protein
MDSNSLKRRAALPALTLLVAAALVSTGCRRGAQGNANAGPAQANASQSGAANSGGAAPGDVAQLNTDIGRLERQAERNPADEETRDELARLYVRRGDAQRGAGQLREALADYQSALRLDPDNDNAQAGAAAVNQELGGDGKEDENGAPVPPPITPNVADEEGKPTPTPTPKKP